MLTPSPALLVSVRRAFHKYGFAKLSMVEIAQECGFTRRALYNYFNNKDDAFRAVVRGDNAIAIESGLAAGEAVEADGGDIVDIMAAIMDVRYGTTRRIVETSPHTVELNAVAFMLCRDIMIDVAVSFQATLAARIDSLAESGRFALREGVTSREIAQTLANGARGVNQALPPAPLSELSERYRSMCRAILFGCIVETPSGAGRTRPSSPVKPKRRS